MQVKSTINLQEVAKFGKFAKNWWNEKASEAKMLHKMNPLRIKYILNQAGKIEGKKILDVGCGGGILSIPLARLKADVYCLEPAIEMVEILKEKSSTEKVKLNIINAGIEECTEADFDIILLMDVVEHVEDLPAFLQAVKARLKPEGVVIISTINNTFLSKFFVKFMAEDVLKIVPKNTHDSAKFVSPLYLQSQLNMKQKNLQGFTYNPLCDSFKLIQNTQMNYFLTLQA